LNWDLLRAAISSRTDYLDLKLRIGILKMKIAYLVHWAEQPNSGVIAKIRAQTTIWLEKNHEVMVFLIVPEENRASLEREFPSGHEILVCSYRSNFSRFVSTITAALAISRWIPDVLYCRQMTYHPAFSYLAHRIPTIIEINTNDARELELGSQIGRLYGKSTRRLRYALCRGMVCVTRELAAAPVFTVFNKPMVVIANGIQLNDYDVFPPPKNDAPALVFLGSKGQVWHGVDKIVRLAKELPNWTFHLIGPDIADLGSEPSANIVLLGHVDESVYLKTMAISDVAIGTLALHRKGMDEACPLKVREYLAAGLPTIIGYSDTDFPEDVSFILRFPNTEHNLDVKRVIDFVRTWRGKRVERSDILQLDIAAKENSRLRFLESFVVKR
jgi:glycosyl transferase family 4